MIFKNGIGVLPKVFSFAAYSFIFNIWLILFKNDVTKTSQFSLLKTCFGENSNKESKIVLKMVLVSYLKPVIFFSVFDF